MRKQLVKRMEKVEQIVKVKQELSKDRGGVQQHLGGDSATQVNANQPSDEDRSKRGSVTLGATQNIKIDRELLDHELRDQGGRS